MFYLKDALFVLRLYKVGIMTTLLSISFIAIFLSMSLAGSFPDHQVNTLGSQLVKLARSRVTEPVEIPQEMDQALADMVRLHNEEVLKFNRANPGAGDQAELWLKQKKTDFVEFLDLIRSKSKSLDQPDRPPPDIKQLEREYEEHWKQHNKQRREHFERRKKMAEERIKEYTDGPLDDELVTKLTEAELDFERKKVARTEQFKKRMRQFKEGEDFTDEGMDASSPLEKPPFDFSQTASIVEIVDSAATDSTQQSATLCSQTRPN